MKRNTPSTHARPTRRPADNVGHASADHDGRPAYPTPVDRLARAADMAVERLEGRRLMSASAVEFAGGVLSVRDASAGGHTLTVELRDDGRAVRGVADGHAGKWVAKSSVKRIVIVGGPHDDVIRIDPKLAIDAHVTAGGGDDTVVTAGGDDSVLGGKGDDVIFTGAGRDRVEGHSGDDYINGGSGRDKLNGDSGRDTLVGTSGDWRKGGSGQDRYRSATRPTPAAIVAKLTRASAARPAASAPSSTTVARSAASGASAPRVTPASSVAPTTSGSIDLSRVSFTLINADTDQPVPGYLNLGDGETLDLSRVPRKLSVRANVPAGFKGSVKFLLNGRTIKTESAAPFALFGDNGGDYNPGALPTGALRLSAEVFRSPNLLGGKLGTVTSNLTVRAGTSAPPASRPATTPPSAPSAAAPSASSPLLAPASNGTAGPIPLVGGSSWGTGDPDGPAPDARIAVLDARVPLGTAVHVNGLVSMLNEGGPEDGQFAWNFGDENGRYNRVEGFNAAHLYDRPGTYPVTLRLTNAAGKVDTATAVVTVVAPDRKTYYVDATRGNDANAGDGPGRAFRSVAAAQRVLGGRSNVEVLFARGQRFDAPEGLMVYGDNVVIGTFGTGDRPEVRWTGDLGGRTIIGVGGSAEGVTVRDLMLSSKYDAGLPAGMPTAVQIGGRNVSVVNNRFKNVGNAINSNFQPRGALVQDNDAPGVTDVRAYFVWTAGEDFVIQGNRVANSAREHVIRMSQIKRVSVINNDFSNIDRRADGDRYDIVKSAVNAQNGEYVYVTANQINGPITVGPLGGDVGVENPNQRFRHALISGNHVSGYRMEVKDGAENVTIRDNVIEGNGGTAIEIDGWDGAYNRGVVDLVVDHNTATNTSDRGTFLKVQGRVNGIVMSNNLYVAPRLKPGGYWSAGVFVVGSDLSSFTHISGNVWPTGNNGTLYARGGVNYIGTGSTGGAGYLNARAWEDRPRVVGSVFRDVNLAPGAVNVTINGTTRGSRRAA